MKGAEKARLQKIDENLRRSSTQTKLPFKPKQAEVKPSAQKQLDFTKALDEGREPTKEEITAIVEQIEFALTGNLRKLPRAADGFPSFLTAEDNSKLNFTKVSS